MYDGRWRLVENPAGRFALRSDAGALVPDRDGSLTLVLAAARPTGCPDGNWLPVPDGPCSVALRTYLPTPAILDGTWSPPPIVRVA
jgi:hypothetical protein